MMVMIVMVVLVVVVEVAVVAVEAVAVVVVKSLQLVKSQLKPICLYSPGWSCWFCLGLISFLEYLDI